MQPVTKQRLDKLLVTRGLAGSRERARALIMSGTVVVNDHTVDKAGTLVACDADVRLKGTDLPYVSRGGLKLAKALSVFDVDVKHRIAIDVGASTGGFTDCLLQHGAARVFAIDVGYGQLAWTLREDPRVVSLERTNIKDLKPDQLSEKPDLAVVDVSFISLEKVLPSVLILLADRADILGLIKPQFEVGRGQVGKGGVVRDPLMHENVTQRISDFAEELSCEVCGIVESPVLGPKGNREFLIHLRKGQS
ncbi:MAG: TlyA family RNA methyltransferase [Deltaproteobacteria bacterium]|jgi:23S rRNA (cytidine1920-2'-O)/16S rRNA (cytidine1409-2'-O)-methyltransferase|nr:TlyA family RNA methyltransferase [Deltaproteobacteria bacterium]